MGPQRVLLTGGRQHFQHGPIDLIIGAEGDAGAVRDAYEQAWQRFQPLLTELTQELGPLRRPIAEDPDVSGPVARRMVRAVAPFRDVFITPMAAVAGAVADEMITSFRTAGIARAYVNNGGDIALHLAPGAGFRIGIAQDRSVKPWKVTALTPAITLEADSGVRGIATSGWRGRSFSLGIADSVTVLATDAALADAAATLVANAVDVDSAAIERRPASDLKDDTDLGARLVTVAVGALSEQEVACALDQGLRTAERMLSAGNLQAAVLVLGERMVTAGSAMGHLLKASHAS